MSGNLTLGQAFFGCDHSGYRVLGITDPRHADAVMRICGELGTPDGFSAVSPFLFGRIVAGTLFMGCCRPGAPDHAGRQTLFFHLLYAPQGECAARGIDTFVLARRGLFKGEASGGCPPLTADDGGPAAPSAPPPFRWDGSPLAIVSREPQTDLLEALLGARAASLSWSGFAFTALAGYAVYAISEYASRPTDRVCRDVNGSVLTAGEAAAPSAPAAPAPAAPSRPAATGGRGWLIAALIVSLALNLLLLWQWFTPAERPVKPSPSAGAEYVSLRELAAEFPAGNRVDWQREIGKDQMMNLKLKYSNPNAAEYDFLHRLERYVNFVNDRILDAGTGRGKR